MSMTHDELIEYGCTFNRVTTKTMRRGYYLDGVFLGTTPRDATDAIRGN